METVDAEMDLGNGGQNGDRNDEDLREVLIVMDKWTRTCDTVLSSLDTQIKKILKSNGR